MRERPRRYERTPRGQGPKRRAPGHLYRHPGARTL